MRNNLNFHTYYTKFVVDPIKKTKKNNQHQILTQNLFQLIQMRIYGDHDLKAAISQ